MRHPHGAGPITALLCATAVALPRHAQAQAALDGWTMTVAISSDSGPGSQRHTAKLRHRFAGHLLRIDSPEPSRYVSRDQTGTFPYFIYDDSAHTRATVEPRVKAVTLSDEPEPLSRALRYSGFEFIRPPRLRVEDLGAAGAILGHPTRAYRVTVSFMAQQTFRGRPCRRTLDTVEQLWAATDLPRVERLREYVRDFPPAKTELHGQVIDSLRALDLRRERMIRGFVLRSVLTSRKPARTGSIVLTDRMEVTELSRGPIPRTLFVVPPNFASKAVEDGESSGSASPLAPLSAEEIKRLDSVIIDGFRRVICDP